MTYRITNQQLQAVCDMLNRTLERPMEPWTKTDNGITANIGNFHISGAYGGVALHEMRNEHGGVRDVFSAGHMPKRELYNRMHAMLDGIQTARENS